MKLNVEEWTFGTTKGSFFVCYSREFVITVMHYNPVWLTVFELLLSQRTWTRWSHWRADHAKGKYGRSSGSHASPESALLEKSGTIRSGPFYGSGKPLQLSQLYANLTFSRVSDCWAFYISTGIVIIVLLRPKVWIPLYYHPYETCWPWQIP